jgi:hypothetical protein
MSNRTRLLAALVLLFALSGPVMARTEGKRSQSHPVVVDPVVWLWEKVAAPVANLLKGGGGCDPNGGILCKPIVTTDGGGGCDPDGSPRCTP